MKRMKDDGQRNPLYGEHYFDLLKPGLKIELGERLTAFTELGFPISIDRGNIAKITEVTKDYIHFTIKSVKLKGTMLGIRLHEGKDKINA